MMSSPSETSSHTLCLAIERVAALVDIAEVNGRADRDLAGVRLLLPRDQLEQGRLAGAVGADDPDDPARRQVEATGSRTAICRRRLLVSALGLDHIVAEPLGHLDQDLALGRSAVLLRLDELVEGLDPRLGLGLARLG